MNKLKAKRLLNLVSNEDIKEMLFNVKYKTEDWSESSIINVSLSKGAAWNILTKDINFNEKLYHIHKLNLLREYGDYLPQRVLDQLVVVKKENPKVEVIHEEPNLDNVKRTDMVFENFLEVYNKKDDILRKLRHFYHTHDEMLVREHKINFILNCFDHFKKEDFQLSELKTILLISKWCKEDQKVKEKRIDFLNYYNSRRND
jgi:hypothetical protein